MCLSKKFKELCKSIVSKLTPTTFIELPSTVIMEELIDPITFEEPIKREIYAFLKDGEKYYLAGSLTILNDMIKNEFRGSTVDNVFIPIRNCLIPTAELHWVRF